MILGNLTLIQKKGLFYSSLEVLPEDRYSLLEAEALGAGPYPKSGSDLPWKQELTPVEEPGVTDYITVLFEDDGQASYPYRLTVWILVEERPEALPTRGSGIPDKKTENL